VRVAILTRADLFPTNHGAAVKIVRTAESLAARGDDVWVITDDRDSYWKVAAGGWETRIFSDVAAAASEVPKLVKAGDLVLLKASRSTGLERVGEALRNPTQ